MRRLIATLLIFLLLGVTGLPFLSWSGNSVFVYADNEITDQDKIRAGITVYLNSKNAYLTNINLPMPAIVGIMEQNIDNFITFYSNQWDNTVLGYSILIENNPFVVKLKPYAVRFFNAFLEWLIDEGKITDNDTTNSLYNGYQIGGNAIFILASNYSYTSVGNTKWIPENYITKGSPVNGISTDLMLQKFNSVNNGFSWINGSDYTPVNYGTINYSSNLSKTLRLHTIYPTSGYYRDYRPWLYPEVDGTQYPYAFLYSNNLKKVIGFPCWYNDQKSASNTFYYGFVSYDLNSKTYMFKEVGHYSRNDVPEGISSAQMNVEKNDFDSTPTEVPEPEEELEYTPKNNTTNNTYNTYNEYYNDYSQKNTYISHPSSEPDPGGTTPDWNDQNTTVTPDPSGGGGFDLSLPDLTLPDLNIDWNINGLKDKFPFSIPWDLMAFFTVLNAEPETPEFEGTIPIGIWEWEIDWNLHYFDNLALLVRNLEFIAFCIGLIIVTRNIIKG